MLFICIFLVFQASFCVFSKIREGLRSTLYDAELKTEILVPGNCLGRIIGKKGSVVSDCFQRIFMLYFTWTGTILMIKDES